MASIPPVDSESLFNMGNRYKLGDCKEIPQNFEQAEKHYFEAGKLGHKKAITHLLDLYLSGKLPFTNAKGQEIFILAKKIKHFSAIHFLGNCYYKFTEKPVRSKCVQMYKHAANNGLLRSMNMLGWFYETGKIGLPTAESAYLAARRWYLKAAQEGYLRAQKNLAALESDRGQYAAAYYWYMKAGGQGDTQSLVDLGVLFHKGLGCFKDWTEAEKLYRAAADAKHPEAHYRMGLLAKDKRDIEGARQWFQKAIDLGYPDAKAELDKLPQEPKVAMDEKEDDLDDAMASLKVEKKRKLDDPTDERPSFDKKTRSIAKAVRKKV